MHQLLDFDLTYEFVHIMCDNTSAITLSKYIMHWAKHLDIKHYFIHDHVENIDFTLKIIDSKNQLVDIFTILFPWNKSWYYLP